ncbi:MAG: SDR family oxidoreductase [Actinocatenispora sp.]
MALLAGRTALVTGGSRGIGRAVVERLAADGAVVVFGYRTDDAAAKQVEESVRAAGGTAHGVRADLVERDGMAGLLADTGTWLTEQGHDGLDIMVNNAALDFRPIPLAEMTDDDFDRVLAVNTRAVFVAMRYAAKSLRDGGRVVNVSTLNTVRSAPGLAAYAASKGALEQLTAVGAHEMGRRGITVNTVSPGATDTDLLRATNSEDGLRMIEQWTPLGRIGEPADVADVIAFLCGPDARWVSGQNLRATGGL